MEHKGRVIENLGTFLARCTCGWTGKLKPYKKTAWLEGYIHRREIKVVGEGDPVKAWEEELMAFLMADEIKMKVKTREWRIALRGYVKAISPFWKSKGVSFKIKNYGETELPHRITIHYDKFNLRNVVKYNNFEFVLFLSTKGVKREFSSTDDLRHLTIQWRLVLATNYLLHLETRYKEKQNEWPIWLRRLRDFYTSKMETIDEYLDRKD